MNKIAAWFLFCLVFMGVLNCNGPENEVYTNQITVDFSEQPVSFDHFWKSTGFTPADLLVENPTMQHAMAMMGTLRGNGVVYVRPHYLLNLIGSRNIGTESVEYNWSKLDTAIDQMVDNNLKPFFELMGFPSHTWEPAEDVSEINNKTTEHYKNNYFNDFQDPVKLTHYKEFVTSLANHLIDRYGMEEVKTWYFETNNEPDLEIFWPFSVQDFLNYYDACSEGLKEASPELIFGGPGVAGALRDEEELFKYFLAHCDTGKNYFSGEQIRLDFISAHIKNPPEAMAEREAEIYQYVRDNHPRLAGIPFINNESDPIAGWGKEYWWRPGPWYASFVVHAIDVNARKIKDSLDVPLEMISNDNAFLGSWGKRTHFTWFVEEGIQGKKGQGNHSPYFYLIKKPVYTVMGLLSMLGEQRYTSATMDSINHEIGIIPTKRQNGDVVLALYNSPDIEINYGREPKMEKDSLDLARLMDKNEIMKLNLTGLPFTKATMVQYQLDDNNGNPYHTWMAHGSPQMPTTTQFLEMQRSQEPRIVKGPVSVAAKGNNMELIVDLPTSSVSFIVLAQQEPVGMPVTNLQAKILRGLNKEYQIHLTWKEPAAPNLLTYEVYFSDNGTNFRKVSYDYLFDHGFNHIYDGDSTALHYKVRVVDYWGNQEESEVLHVRIN